MSTFTGLSAALSALHANQRAMEVTANNVANVNTPGYARQRVSFTEIADYAHPGPHSQSTNIGDGVRIDKVERIQDTFLENRGRIEHAQNAYLGDQKRLLERIEQTFGEPSDTALQAKLTEFWSALGDAANRPADQAARAALITRGTIVADGMRDMATQMASVWDSNLAQLGALVTEINAAAKTVATLNEAVVASHINAQPANELANQRDVAVMKLAELSGATVANRPDGSVDVLLGGSLLVSGNMARQLAPPSGATTLADAKVANGPRVEIKWADSTTAKVASTSGSLAASLEGLNSTLPTYARALDTLAVNFATAVNDRHDDGQTDAGVAGGPMFGPDPNPTLDASTIRMQITSGSDLALAKSDPNHIGVKDGSNAEWMAGLAAEANGPDREYRRLVVDLGAQTQSTKRRSEIQAATTAQVDADRTSHSGVNLDEEMSNLVQFERSYAAAAKVIATIDEMLDVLINRM